MTGTRRGLLTSRRCKRKEREIRRIVHSGLKLAVLVDAGVLHEDAEGGQQLVDRGAEHCHGSGSGTPLARRSDTQLLNPVTDQSFE